PAGEECASFLPQCKMKMEARHSSRCHSRARVSANPKGVFEIRKQSVAVVPAKAGTHNHREWLFQRKLTDSVFQQFRRGVWVPDFAGTTASCAATSSVARSFALPAPNRGRAGGA